MVQHRSEESFAKIEEVRSKIVPIISDKRPEARALLKQVLPSGLYVNCCGSPARCFESLHIRFGITPPQLEAAPAAGSSNEPSAPKAQPAEPAAAVPPGETLAAGGFTMIALQLLKLEHHHINSLEMSRSTISLFRKARLSQLDTQPFPLVDRVATKELVQNVIFTKAGNLAKIQLQLAGHEPSAKAVDDLLQEKAKMDAKWQALRKIDDTVSEETWVDAMKDVTRAYFAYLSKEELLYVAGVCPWVLQKREEADGLGSTCCGSWGQSHHFIMMAFMTSMIFIFLFERPTTLQKPGDDPQEQSSGPRLKRRASAVIRSAKKARKNEDNVDFSQLPLHLQNMDEGYSTLAHMCETPMPNAVLGGLRKKSADISFLCGTMCDAAVQEGSNKFLTKTLATITREARFHSRLASSLPKVELIKLPVQIKFHSAEQLVQMDGEAAEVLEPHGLWSEFSSGPTTALRLVDLIHESPELREVLSDAGPNDVFLRLHGDEGPFFKKRNLLVLSLSFPHNHGDTIMTRLALCHIGNDFET
ncbi:unnamed protein product [Symbiodinium necroappetens]|uniref:Uncharacterized protein n=1 Tax=Symbiodinium necroappetens TaxID=1628268 RepID=A0A812Z5K6_9DINO|nr:unnamed protein product [Symbiodinium necroappetens]